MGSVCCDLHVTGGGTDQQSDSRDDGLAERGTGGLGHVGGNQVLDLVHYGVYWKSKRCSYLLIYMPVIDLHVFVLYTYMNIESYACIYMLIHYFELFMH